MCTYDICECSYYSREGSKGLCEYCDHPHTRHIRIERKYNYWYLLAWWNFWHKHNSCQNRCKIQYTQAKGVSKFLICKSAFVMNRETDTTNLILATPPSLAWHYFYVFALKRHAWLATSMLASIYGILTQNSFSHRLGFGAWFSNLFHINDVKTLTSHTLQASLCSLKVFSFLLRFQTIIIS